METDQLRVFLAVAESGSFTEAAHRMFLSHSTISRRISSLEEETGVLLFERGNSVHGLTPAGKALLPLAEKIVALSDEAEAMLRSMPKGNVGE